MSVAEAARVTFCVRKCDMPDEDEIRRKVTALAEQIGELHERALAEYSPVVEHILGSGNRDASHIEHTLDGLLGFCGSGAVLHLYRRLCRHYYEIDTASAVSYVHAYRAMYGCESDPGADGGREASQR